MLKRKAVITKLLKNSINNQYTRDKITLPHSNTLRGDIWIGFKKCNLQPKLHMLFISQVNLHSNIKKFGTYTSNNAEFHWFGQQGMHW